MSDIKTPKPQINVRAPEAAREFLLRLAAHLRADPTFLPRAEGWLRDVEAGEATHGLTERMNRLEAQLASLADATCPVVHYD